MAIANYNDTNLFWVYHVSSILYFSWYASFRSAWYFACGKRDIAPTAQWYPIRAHNCCRQYHSAKPNITAEQYNSRKANRTEKTLANASVFSGGRGWIRTIRVTAKSPVFKGIIQKRGNFRGNLYFKKCNEISYSDIFVSRTDKQQTRINTGEKKETA